MGKVTGFFSPGQVPFQEMCVGMGLGMILNHSNVQSHVFLVYPVVFYHQRHEHKLFLIFIFIRIYSNLLFC